MSRTDPGAPGRLTKRFGFYRRVTEAPVATISARRYSVTLPVRLTAAWCLAVSEAPPTEKRNVPWLGDESHVFIVERKAAGVDIE